MIRGAAGAAFALAVFAGLLMPEQLPALAIDAECQSKYALETTADGQVIENVTIRNAREAVVLVQHDDVVIRNVTIEQPNCAGDYSDQYAAGIACWGCSRLTVQDSRIDVGGLYGNGIWMKNTGGGHVIIGNTITGGYDGIGGETESSSTSAFNRDTLIEGNTISGCDDDGIQVEGGTANVTVRGNTVTGCGIGIAFAPSFGSLLVEGNTLRDMKVSSQGAQSCYKLGSGGSGTVTVRGNTCVTQGDGFKQTNSGLGSRLIVSGNCLNVSRYVIEFGQAPPSGSTFDNDTLATTDTGRFIKWAGTRYGSLSAFQTGTGQEANGRVGICTTIPVTVTPSVIPTLVTPVTTPTVTPTPTASPTVAPIPSLSTPTLQPTTPPVRWQTRCRWRDGSVWRTVWRDGPCEGTP